MTKLHFDDGKSQKFWEISVDGTSHTVRYGRAGSNGQSKTKSFDSAEEAQTAADKLIAQKKKKGYAEDGDNSEPKPAGATPAAPRAVAATPANAPATGVGSHRSADGIAYVVAESELSDDDFRTVKDIVNKGELEELKPWLEKGTTMAQWSNFAAYTGKAGHLAMAKLFLSIGAVDSIDLCSRLAAQEGHIELLKLYVAHGLDLDNVDAKNKSPLTSSASNNRLEVTKWILGQKKIRKASANKALRLACQQNHVDVVRYLVEEAKVSVDAKEGKDASTVVSAAGRGHLEMLEYLHKSGATTSGTLGGAALQRALNSSKEEAVLWLLEHGATLPKSAVKDAIRTAAENGLVAVLAKFHAEGIVYREAAAETFLESFSFLCASDADRILLSAMAAAVQKVVGKKQQTFHFANEMELECEPATLKNIPKGIPGSFAEIAKEIGSVVWDAGGPMMGFGGVHEEGYIIGSDGGLDAVAESDEKLAERLSEAGATDSFCCGQNFLLFDPTRKNAAGEDALAFVSHGDCEWTEVKSADDLDYKGVLLRLMAQAMIDASELPEIYA